MDMMNDARQPMQCISVFSPSILPVFKQALVVASKKVPVLIEGESSVGKNFLADFIRKNSNRADKPYVIINGNEMSETLFASELFGYSANAFTGAGSRNKQGLIESANKGTILFARINELSLNNQAILLHFLQNMTILPVGSLKYKPIDARIITTSNEDLKKMCEDGRFREDLYYRLSVVNFHIPAVRERKEDIPSMFSYLVRRHTGLDITDAWPSDEKSHLLEMMTHYTWPGNIHELNNFIQNLCIATDPYQYYRRYLSAHEDIPDSQTILRDQQNPANQYGRTPAKETEYPFLADGLTLKDAMSEFEKYYIQKTIQKTNNLHDAAKALGIGYSSLCRKRAEFRQDGK